MAGSGRRRPLKFKNKIPIPSPPTCSAPQTRKTAIGFNYPAAAPPDAAGDGPTSPIALAGTGDAPPILAFTDRNPGQGPPVRVPSYEYDPMVVGGVGLGFQDESDAMEAAAGEGGGLVGFKTPSPSEAKKKNKGGGFLAIGGIRVYTEDTSSPEEEADETDEEDDHSESGDSINVASSDSYSTACDGEDGEDGEEDVGDRSSDGSSEGSSVCGNDSEEIDDELVKDYLEGIGGSAELLSEKWLASMNLDDYGNDDFLLGGGGGDGKLGVEAVMSASKEYGKKPKAKKGKGFGKPREVGSANMDIGSSRFDDFLFEKDGRFSSRKKKSPSVLSRSWPNEARKVRKYYGVPGEKKKHRKEQIAVRRRERMINRGVDLDQINLKLRQMVIDEVDIFSFERMHLRDCSQVRRLASIYRLHSGCQGSGKKRFVTVTRTHRTCMPSSEDKLRLDKLLRAGIDDDDFTVNYGKVRSQANGIAKTDKKLASGPASAPVKLTKSNEASGRRNRTGKQSSVSYAEPVSFVSCGVMQADPTITETTAVDSSGTEKIVENNTSSFGAFEMHTRGFGSKMMAKMGFVEGSGLGREGQGIVNPIEAIQRPKSLGLGVEFTETTVEVSPAPKSIGPSQKHRKGDDIATTPGIGSFEKHTKGFGSKMMAKMGFVPGMGLGKDAQGITTPLTARKLPKSRGLGSKY